MKAIPDRTIIPVAKGGTVKEEEVSLPRDGVLESLEFSLSTVGGAIWVSALLRTKKTNDLDQPLGGKWVRSDANYFDSDAGNILDNIRRTSKDYESRLVIRAYNYSTDNAVLYVDHVILTGGVPNV